MNADLDRLLEMQRLDNRAIALQKEIAALPVYVSKIEKTLDTHLKKVEADRAILAANQKDRKQQDVDIQTHQQKIAKLREQMNSAKNNDQFRAFQHEIEFCETSIRKCEDRIIELMEKSEPLTAAVTAAEGALAKEKAQVDKEKKIAVDRSAADKEHLAKLLEERKVIAAEMAPSVLNVYEKLRKRNDVAVADATTGRCSACQMALRPQFMQDLKKRESVMLCETCRRIVVYNPVTTPEAMNQPVNTISGTRVDMT
jgi:predicted  nucleic acid-binding Zn-ribbon protein